jgi:hypothetical protein
VASKPGRDVIRVTAAEGIELRIVDTNPADYIRNIRVIMPGGIYADDPHTVVYDPDPERDDYLPFRRHYRDIVFHPDFLSDLEGYEAVRFMNWQKTNGSQQQAAPDRPRLKDAQWTIAGPPVEVMVDLANRVGFDPWFNIPHLANDAYVRAFARRVEALLRPDLTAYVEYSNEVWNTTFIQHDYAEDRGLSLRLDTDPYRAASKFYARRSTEIFLIWEGVFGGSEGFTAVAGAKSWDVRDARTILDYGEMLEHSDVLAIGVYFGFEATWSQNCNRVASMNLTEFVRYARDELIPITLDRVENHDVVAREYGIPLIAYEGGQHFTTNGCYGNQTKQRAVESLFDRFNRDSRVRYIYLDFLQDVHDAGVVLFAHYQTTGKWTNDGRFGVREHLLQTREEAPKYDALLTWMGM